MKGRFSDNPDYTAYKRLLLQLQELGEAGLSESAEADSVRDAMDTHWPRLTPEERSHLEGLSSDLYLLSGEEAFDASSPLNQQPAQRIAELTEARAGADAERVLALLRLAPRVIPEHDVAAMRAWAYDALGDEDVARAFTRFATRLAYLNGRDGQPFRVRFDIAA